MVTGVALTLGAQEKTVSNAAADDSSSEEVIIRRSRRAIRLVHLEGNSFLEALRRKLQWRGTYL